MSNTNRKVEELFKFCDKNSKNENFKKVEEIIKNKFSKLTDEQKEVEIKNFINVLQKSNYMSEGVIDKLKTLSLGALLATCLINPAYAEIVADNIQVHHPVVAKYESGKKGYDCVAKDNYGGYSYGNYQLSTERRNGNPSTFDYFMKYAKKKDPNIEFHLRKAGGWEAAHKGDKAFIDKWCELTYRKDFRDVYDGFFKEEEFMPVYKRMDKSPVDWMKKVTDWASNNKATQAALQSAIVQHGKGGAYDLIKTVLKGKKKISEEEFIKELYAERAKQFSKYRTRYKNECADVLKYLNSDESKIN